MMWILHDHAAFCTTPESGMCSTRNRAVKMQQKAAVISEEQGALGCRAPSTQLLNFVDINDGRISRVHCIFRPLPSAPRASNPDPNRARLSAATDCQKEGGLPSGTSLITGSQDHGKAAAAVSSGVLLLDCSSNGTFVNGDRAQSKGLGTQLTEGDRVSLVLSVTPLIEQYFIFHAGGPTRCVLSRSCLALVLLQHPMFRAYMVYTAGEPPRLDDVVWAPMHTMPCPPAEDMQLLSSPAATRLRMRSLQVGTWAAWTCICSPSY
jgi:hypothetical protein